MQRHGSWDSESVEQFPGVTPMRKKNADAALGGRSSGSGSAPEIEARGVEPGSKLVFISHDTRDSALAEAFGNLIADASGGVLKSFRSSDKKGTAGIDYGKEWYNAVMDALTRATDVVALLTQHSIGRPWILFEAGVAKGKRGTDSVVFGVTLGVPLQKAISGPFSQFQNSGDSEDELTKVVMQLVRRVPNAEPREEAVRKLVQAFRQEEANLLKHPAKSPTDDRVDESAVAKLFEEVKVLFRDLPQLVEGKLREMRPEARRCTRRFHPMMLEEILHGSLREEMRGDDSVAWLMFASLFREDVPWLYEAAMEVYRALRSRDKGKMEDARKHFQKVTRILRHGHPMIFEMMGVEREEMFMALRHLPRAVDHFLDNAERAIVRAEQPAPTTPRSKKGEIVEPE